MFPPTLFQWVEGLLLNQRRNHEKQTRPIKKKKISTESSACAEFLSGSHWPGDAAKRRMSIWTLVSLPESSACAIGLKRFNCFPLPWTKTGGNAHAHMRLFRWPTNRRLGPVHLRFSFLPGKEGGQVMAHAYCRGGSWLLLLGLLFRSQQPLIRRRC